MFAKPSRVISTTLITLVLFFNTGSAWATDDTEPVLDSSSGQLSSTNLFRGDILSFSFRVTDNVACCSWAGWGIYTDPGQNIISGNVIWNSNSSASSFRISGNELDGRYSFSVLIPNDIAYGTYYLKAQAIDNVGWYTHLDQIGTFTVSERPSNSSNTTSSNTTATSSSSTTPTPKPSSSKTRSASPTPSPTVSPTPSAQPVEVIQSPDSNLLAEEEGLEKSSENASVITIGIVSFLVGAVITYFLVNNFKNKSGRKTSDNPEEVDSE